MPMTDYPAAPMKAPPAPKYPTAKGMPPEEVEALLAQGYFDGGDGELIPPMPDNPYSVQKETPGIMTPPAQSRLATGLAQFPQSTTPMSNAGGGPTTPPPDIRSDIFKGLYRAGKRGGNQMLMDMARPPVPAQDPMAALMPPPLDAPVEEPFLLQAQPHTMPGPMAPQGPGPNTPMGRFPRAASRMQRPPIPPMQRGQY